METVRYSSAGNVQLKTPENPGAYFGKSVRHCLMLQRTVVRHCLMLQRTVVRHCLNIQRTGMVKERLNWTLTLQLKPKSN